MRERIIDGISIISRLLVMCVFIWHLINGFGAKIFEKGFSFGKGYILILMLVMNIILVLDIKIWFKNNKNKIISIGRCKMHLRNHNILSQIMKLVGFILLSYIMLTYEDPEFLMLGYSMIYMSLSSIFDLIKRSGIYEGGVCCEGISLRWSEIEEVRKDKGKRFLFETKRKGRYSFYVPKNRQDEFLRYINQRINM